MLLDMSVLQGGQYQTCNFVGMETYLDCFLQYHFNNFATNVCKIAKSVLMHKQQLVQFSDTNYSHPPPQLHRCYFLSQKHVQRLSIYRSSNIDATLVRH